MKQFPLYLTSLCGSLGAFQLRFSSFKWLSSGSGTERVLYGCSVGGKKEDDTRTEVERDYLDSPKKYHFYAVNSSDIDKTQNQGMGEQESCDEHEDEGEEV